MAIGWARQAGARSLLDLSEPQWRELARSTRRVPGADSGMRASSEAFLIHARDAVESLRDGVGWETEYPRDIWRLSRLPGLTLNSGRSSTRGCLRFDRVAQPWLRELGKRWVRLRLCSGLSAATASGRRSGADAVQRVPGRCRTRRELPGWRRPGAAGTLPGMAGSPAGRSRHQRTLDQRPAVFLPGDPPVRLGRHAAGNRRVLRRRLPAASATAHPPPGRVRHGPGREPRQPRPLARSRRPGSSP